MFLQLDLFVCPDTFSLTRMSHFPLMLYMSYTFLSLPHITHDLYLLVTPTKLLSILAPPPQSPSPLFVLLCLHLSLLHGLSLLPPYRLPCGAFVVSWNCSPLVTSCLRIGSLVEPFMSLEFALLPWPCAYCSSCDYLQLFTFVRNFGLVTITFLDPHHQLHLLRVLWLASPTSWLVCFLRFSCCSLYTSWFTILIGVYPKVQSRVRIWLRSFRFFSHRPRMPFLVLSVSPVGCWWTYINLRSINNLGFGLRVH